MRRTTPSSEPAPPATCQPPALRNAPAQNYTAQRVLRALEVIVLRPSSAPAVAETIGIHPRTARRILNTLAINGYVERRGGHGRSAHEYQPTVRLLSLAAALGPRLPLVSAARKAVRDIEGQSELTAYVVVPCYSDVLVVASSGARAVRPWAMFPAHSDAAGRVLLAFRDPWRRSLARVDERLVLDDEEATAVVASGYASHGSAGERSGSLAVPVPSTGSPIAALAVRGRCLAFTVEYGDLIARLQRCADQIAEDIDAPLTGLQIVP
jgi:DNA-binding IclR family transcriptional regulator